MHSNVMAQRPLFGITAQHAFELPTKVLGMSKPFTG